MGIQLQKISRNEDAVSAVVGEIVLTAIVVIAFSIIIVSLFSYLGSDKKVNADIDGWVDIDSSTIYLRHLGGETIDLNTVRIIFNLNGTRYDLSSREITDIASSDKWNLGEVIPFNTLSLWNITVNENDYIGMVLLQTGSNTVIKSGSLLGDESSYSPASSELNDSDSGTGTSGGGELAWWKFNENSGTIAYDYTGSHNGAIYQAAWTAGINGSALEFDGINDYVLVDERIVESYPFTVSVWVKTGYSGPEQAVVNLADPAVDNSYYGIYLSEGRAGLVAGNTASGTITGDEVNDGQWHNIVAVFSSSTERTLYVDGIVNGTASAGVSFNNDADRWSVGVWGDSSPSGYFEGTIDEVRLWDKAMDQSEVKAYYESYVQDTPEQPPADTTPVPVSRWKLDEGSGSVAYDSVGGNDAQIIGARWKNNGINGTAISFDGNGDYLVISDNNSLDFDGNMSLLFWLYLSTSNDVQIIGKGMNDRDNFELFASGGELYFEWADSDSNHVSTAGMDLRTNTWYQIGVVADGNNVVFYRNADFVEQHSMRGVPLAPNDYDMWIGRQNYGSNNYYLRGNLDEIEIYDVALSGTDIEEYYARTNM